MKLLSKRPVLFGWATTLAIFLAHVPPQRRHPRVPRVVIDRP